MAARFVTGTAGFWQALAPAASFDTRPVPPYRYGYPARLPSGDYLVLPIRVLPGDGDRAVASLIVNHASFAVTRALAGFMTELARPLGADCIVGLPTLGLALAPLVAEGLGHDRYVPLGYSRKFWYDEALSVPVRSLTTPDGTKRAYIDPNLAPLLRGRRVVIVDDAISSGETVRNVLPLLDGLGAAVAGIVVAMLQGERWRAALGAAAAVHGVFESPLLAWTDAGWIPTA
jgi:adenine/guanine phosphoribosyltransferase-like PRPP-binding protein